eukprot:s1549_g4.t1
MEFIEGAARLRGNAKALDIWRIETKMEVLIEEVLKEMKGLGKEVKLQDVFDNSMFRHIKTTTIGQVSEGPERGGKCVSTFSATVDCMDRKLWYWLFDVRKAIDCRWLLITRYTFQVFISCQAWGSAHGCSSETEPDLGEVKVNDVFRKDNYEHLRAASWSFSRSKFATG